MSCSSTILGDILIPPLPMFRIVPAVPGRERHPSPFWDPGPALCLSYHKLPEDATGCAGPMSRRRLWARNSSQQKARAQEGPVPQRDVRGLAAAACRPPGLEKNEALAARVLSFLGWESALFGCAGACHAGSYEPGNDKNGCKRKARAQEGPCPAAGCARLGRGSLPPKQPPVKAADFSFTAGNLAEALNPFFIFDKIQEGKSKHRPLSCKHN